MIVDLAKNKQEFEELARKYIKRDGLDRLLNWLDETDFYTAPASTKYHLSVEGGLCQHSLNVFHAMVKLCNTYWNKAESDDNIYNGTNIEVEGSFNLENITVVTLFHDICKANCYIKDWKNVKVDGKWVQEEYWKWEEQFIYGHGTKSVYILQQYMRLYIEEAQAIRFHMGGREDPLTDNYERLFAQVFEKSKFAVILHLADNWSSFLIEADEGKE